MFIHRRDPDAEIGVGVAFTSAALDLGDNQPAEPRAAAYAALSDALGVPVAVTAQVHGNDVWWADAPGDTPGLVDATRHEADALVTTREGLGLAVRVADCVPILLATTDGAVVAAVHAGRAGLLNGVIGRAVDAMRSASAAPLVAWVGPHVCAACYEVPAAMAAESCERLGVAATTTSWGTPSLDLGAATAAQLAGAGARVEFQGGCTLHGQGLHSHRGGSTGRLVGVIWRARGTADDSARGAGVPHRDGIGPALG